MRIFDLNYSVEISRISLEFSEIAAVNSKFLNTGISKAT